MSEPTKNEIGLVVLEEVLLAARRAAEQAQESDGAFEHGLKSAYYDVLTVAMEQAKLFDLDPAEFGMSGFDPDALLKTRPIARAA